jgi:hypothetical protein
MEAGNVSLVQGSLREFKQSQLWKAGTRILKDAPFVWREVDVMWMMAVV